MRQPVKRMKLYEAMKQDIVQGIYLPGSFLPNELELAKKYGHARDTVRLALALLEDEKIIELKKNKGRRICPANIEKAKVPLTFLLPCPDFISETFSNVFAQNNRRMLKGVSQIAFEYDSRVETVPVSPTNNAHEIDWRKLDFVNADSMLVVNGFWYRDLFPQLLKRGCRVALVNRQDFYLESHKDFVNSSFRITLNVFGATEAAVEYLFRQGCRRIALFHRYILEPEHPIMGGYLSGLRKCGLAFAAWHEQPEEHMTLENVRNQLKDFRKNSGGFDGILMDPVTVYELRLHNIYHQLGLPENVKIITSEDSRNSQWMMPQLTGMAFPYEDIGRIAARHLLSPEFSSREQLINARLIERESTSAFSEKAKYVSA
jgi:DNA-binding LacI/PurR family transcriptional regulator